MDARIEEAFLRCWLELIPASQNNEKPLLLPMEPSTFQKDYLASYADPVFGKLNLKESSFKKVKQFY